MTPIIAAPIRAPTRLPTPPVAVKELYRDSIRLRGDRAFQDLECMDFILVWICWWGLKSGVTALFRCGSERF